MAQTSADTLARERAPVRELNWQEGHALLDQNARYYLGISGEEFLRRWKAGEYREPDADPNVMLVASLLPFVR
ncbi:MAG: hypothetical protein HY332_10750 [Chloroflexi bacterium]|nr:hypothetical protein [Chloroflexota bacterium]